MASAEDKQPIKVHWNLSMGIGDHIQMFLHRIIAIKVCAQGVIPNVSKIQRRETDDTHKVLARSVAFMEATNVNGHARIDPVMAHELLRAVTTIRIHSASPFDAMLTESLLISAFAGFDAFLGDLLRQLYGRVPNLILSSQKTLEMKEVLACDTIQEVKIALIEKEIDELLRDSYVSSFGALERRFSINTLKSFRNWGAFVEASQRRNLVTHCRGVVSKQYLEVCPSSAIPGDAELGKHLPVTLEYLLRVLEVLYEVGLKLGQVLWRKLLPGEHEAADTQLMAETVDCLTREEWALANEIAEFAASDVKHPASEKNRLIFLINRAQTLRWLGDVTGCISTLNQHDWSGATRDFRLAVSVLQQDFDKAAELMVKIGKNGEHVNSVGYLTWPLFREFRGTDQFRVAFEEVYGTRYEESLSGTIKTDVANELVKTEAALTEQPECVDDAVKDFTELEREASSHLPSAQVKHHEE